MSTAVANHETTADTRTHHVYRLFSAEGVLLYVGISMNVGERFKQHRGEKAWWPDVDHWTIQDAPTRADAFFLEADAILTEHPLHNKDIPTLARYDVLRSRATLPHGGLSPEERIRSLETRLRRVEAEQRQDAASRITLRWERDQAREALAEAESLNATLTESAAAKDETIDELLSSLKAANEIIAEKEQARVFIVEGPSLPPVPAPVHGLAYAPAPPRRHGLLGRLRGLAGA